MSASLLLPGARSRKGATRVREARAIRIPGRPLFAVGVALSLALAAAWVSDPRTLPIRSVRIEGEFRHLLPSALEALAKDVVRGGFFNVNVEAVQNALLEEEWVASVIVRRVWPDTLTLQVSEQTAVARWGEEGLLNEQAVLFSPDDMDTVLLPLLRGPRDSGALVLERFRFLQEALARRGLAASELSLDERRAWTFRLEGGATVNLGRGHFVERLERFVQSLPPQLMAELAAIESIDMRYTNGFAVRWKPVSAAGSNTPQEPYGQES